MKALENRLSRTSPCAVGGAEGSYTRIGHHHVCTLTYIQSATDILRQCLTARMSDVMHKPPEHAQRVSMQRSTRVIRSDCICRAGLLNGSITPWVLTVLAADVRAFPRVLLRCSQGRQSFARLAFNLATSQFTVADTAPAKGNSALSSIAARYRAAVPANDLLAPEFACRAAGAIEHQLAHRRAARPSLPMRSYATTHRTPALGRPTSPRNAEDPQLAMRCAQSVRLNESG